MYQFIRQTSDNNNTSATSRCTLCETDKYREEHTILESCHTQKPAKCMSLFVCAERVCTTQTAPIETVVITAQSVNRARGASRLRARGSSSCLPPLIQQVHSARVLRVHSSNDLLAKRTRHDDDVGLVVRHARARITVYR